MAVDPNIALQSQGLGPLVNPMQIAQQAQQMRIQREQAAALEEQRQATAEQRQQQADKLKRDQANEQMGQGAIDTLFSGYQPGQQMPTAPVGQLYKAYGPERGAAIVKGLIDFHNADLSSADGLRKSMLTRIAGIKALPPDRQEAAYTAIIQDYAQKGVVKPEEVAPYSPQQLDAYEQQLLTPDERAKLPGVLAGNQKAAADAAVAQQVAAGAKGGLTPEQQATNARADAQAAETSRHNRTQEGLERQKAADARGDVTALTPEGLDAAAQMFAKTGQLPALGMGDKTTRKQIINRAAALMPGLDLASAKADYGANTSSLKNVTGTLDTLTSFENTAGKNLDAFLASYQKLKDTGSPLLNAPLRALEAKVAGNPDVAAAHAAGLVALREIARVTNDPKLSGVLSDSARQEVSGLVPNGATLPQLVAVAKVLRQDMANVHGSLSDQKDAIAARIAKASDTAPKSAGGTVKMQAPNGQTSDVPADQVEHFKALGAKVIG